jgi:hypothetical protein
MVDIMNADKESVDTHSEGKLVREGKDFDTKARTDVMIQDASKKGKGSKPCDTGCLKMADDNSLYNTSGK